MLKISDVYLDKQTKLFIKKNMARIVKTQPTDGALMAQFGVKILVTASQLSVWLSRTAQWEIFKGHPGTAKPLYK